MNISFQKSNLNEIKPLMSEYLNSLTGVTEDFWEEHIINADTYRINDNQEPVGCFSIFGNDKITMFYVLHDYLNNAQEIFKRILEDYKIKTAFVATCDPLFLALCMDFHKKIELQAYFFDGTKEVTVREPEYGRELISEIRPEEMPVITKKTDNFFEFPTQEIYEKSGYKIFRLSVGGEDLGYGIYGRNKLTPQYYACGMITLPEHRQKGVGRSLQIHLADIVRELGGIPISGCWYYNTNSKKTIESAGRYSSGRLLNVLF